MKTTHFISPGHRSQMASERLHRVCAMLKIEFCASKAQALHGVEECRRGFGNYGQPLGSTTQIIELGDFGGGEDACEYV
jgi:hypothetical protein